MRLAKNGFLIVLLVVSLTVLVMQYSATTAGLPTHDGPLFEALDPPQAVAALLQASRLDALQYIQVQGILTETMTIKGQAFAKPELKVEGLGPNDTKIKATNVITRTKTSGFPKVKISAVSVQERPAIKLQPISNTILKVGQQPVTSTLVLNDFAFDVAPHDAQNIKFKLTNERNAKLTTPGVKYRDFAAKIQQGIDLFETKTVTKTMPGVIELLPSDGPEFKNAVPTKFDLKVSLDAGIPSAMAIMEAAGDQDACPDSDLSETVVIGDCDTGVANVLFDDGCTMSDLIARCAGRATSRGHFVSCVAGLATGWEMAGFIDGIEHGSIQRCAARSSLQATIE